MKSKSELSDLNRAESAVGSACLTDSFCLPFSTALFWVNSVYMDAEGSSVTVTVVREGYQGRSG